MWKHTLSLISNKVLNDAVPGMHCVVRVEPPATTEGLVEDYPLRGRDRGLSVPRVVSTAFCH